MLVHSESDRLARALARCDSHSISWNGDLYRSSSPRYGNKDDLLTGAGSKTAGARWNPPNSFRTLYTSLDPHTAIDEALSHFAYYALPIATAMPRIIVSPDRLRGKLDAPASWLRIINKAELPRNPWP